MRIVALLVFDEVLGRREFADIVIEGADTGEKWIRSDRSTRILSKLAHCMRVLVRSRRAHRELPEHRKIGV